MAPKFRGDSEDWLDEEDKGEEGSSSGRPAAKSKNRGRSLELPPEEANATVAEVFKNQCRIRLDSSGGAEGREFLAAYRRAEVIGSNGVRERSPVAVGDRVRVQESAPGQGLVDGICARRNALYRPAPGREGTDIRHVIASNLDQLVIVASVARPEFSLGLVDRYLIAAAVAGIPTRIVINKADLLDDVQGPPLWSVYREAGYPVHEVSAKKALGMEELKAVLVPNETVAFCGHSGVGKTSLLRTLTGREVGKVGEVSQSTGKGQHTTTSAVLLPEGSVPGAQWIDTPGVRAFGLIGVTAEELALYFPEFKGLGCARNGCRHIDQAGCEAMALARYPSFRRIHDSLLAGEN